MKIGDMINGQNSIKVRTSQISTMLTSRLNLMHLRKKKTKFSPWKLKKPPCMNHLPMKEALLTLIS